MEENGIQNLWRETQIKKVLAMNLDSQKYGLQLSEEEAKVLIREREQCLRETRRIEFGEGILEKLISIFCDSPFLLQENYAETLVRLQSIFYLYKNESLDELTDEELLEEMKKKFDGECQGDLEFLETTALERFARSIRSRTHKFIGKYAKEEE